MIVKRIEVRNWRGLRDRHAFEFDQGINLLVGKNEAGKSTLFEALQRVLFDRHGTEDQKVKDIRPLGTSLAPEAEVTVRAKGSRYRIRKRFLDSAESVFWVERDGSWEREHEGDRADEEARQLVEGDVPGRGATKVEHRGIGQALWYLQRESPVPEQQWNEAVQQGLEGVLDVSASGPVEKRILNRVAEAYGQHWTPKLGDLSVNSPLSRLKEEVGSLEAELSDVRSRLEQADELRGELEDLAVQREQYEQAREDAETRREKIRAQLDDAKELEELRRDLGQELDEAERRLEATQDDLDTLEELDEELEEIEGELEAARKARSDARHQAEVALKSAKAARRRRREELEPERREAVEQIDALRDLRRAIELRERCEDLEDELEEVREARAELEQTNSELRDLHAPSADEMAEYREAASERAVVEARMEASAIRVAFDFDEAPEITSRPDAQIEQDEASFLVTEPTVFSVGELGSVAVEGVGPTLEDLRDRTRELRATLADMEERFGAEDQDHVEEIFQRRESLERKVGQLRDRIEELGDEEELEDELARVENNLQEAEDGSEILSDDQRELTGEALDQAIDDLEGRRDELASAIEEAETEEEEAAGRHEELSGAAQERASDVSSLEARLKEKRNRISQVIDEYGTRSGLEDEHSDREATLEERRSALAEVEDEFEEKVLHPREELEKIGAEIQEIEEDDQELKERIAGIQGRIYEVADQELYARAGDLEAKLDEKRRRLDVLRTRAEGAKLAKQLLDALEEERRETLAGPVNEKVERWIQVLTDKRYDQLHVDQDLHPSAVRHTRYGAPLGVEQLSFGTQEQVVVLFRLAIGTVLGEDERQLVILDDRLVNADTVRTRRFCDILEDAASSCQILLATCTESRYARLSGPRIRVPEDGRVEGEE